MKDSWKSGDPYEYYMGRWSNFVAQSFVDWLSPPSGLIWLDVGCGTGALSQSVINSRHPENLIAIDQSEGFIEKAQNRLGSRAHCRIGNATDLPLDDSSVNITVSGLVLNFLAEPGKALSEMKRVTMPGGTVAAYVWDYAGKMEFLRYFWDTAVEINSRASNLHESYRFPTTNVEALKGLFDSAGFVETEISPIDIDTHFRDFDDYWKPFLGGQGPAPTYVLSLDEPERKKIQDVLFERLPVQKDGSISMVARAWAVRGMK